MMKRWISFFLFVGVLIWGNPSYAVDINLINVDMSPNDDARLANAYGQAYGYSPQQVAPAMYGPPEEVPAILQIAQAAGTVPMTVWMMRRMGMNYGSILSTFAVAPSILAGPRWTDPFYVQTARVNFLRNVLGVPVNMLRYVPWGGVSFSRSLLYPYHPVHGTWMPPGIAKKYGLWMPPGQAKKMGWGPWGWDDGGWGKHDKQSWKGGPSGSKGFENGGDFDKHSWKDDKGASGGNDKGGGNGKGNGKENGGQTNLSKGDKDASPGNGKGSSKGNGGGKSKGNAQGGSSSNSPGGQGKGKK